LGVKVNDLAEYNTVKITFIQPRYDPKPVGGMKVVYEYANQLVARGHQVSVLHPDRLANLTPRRLTRVYFHITGKSRQTENYQIMPEVPWHHIDNRVRMLTIPEPTASYVPDGDAVFASFWATGEYMMDYPPEKGRKFYLWQGFEEGWAGPTARIYAVLKSPLKKVVISRALYEHGLNLGLSQDEMIHIPDAIDHKTYQILNPIDDRIPRVSMLYHSLPLKGANDGVKALDLAKKAVPTLQAVLFSVFTRPHRLPQWIEYSCNPSQEELINSIYNRSSIYLSPSRLEGFGLTAAEAMACGCAVAAADSGGIRDFAEHEVTALLSPPKDSKALASNILRLQKDDDLRVRLAKAGNERIKEFTWERSTHLLEQLIINEVG